MYYSTATAPKTLTYPSDASLTIRTSSISRSSITNRWSVANTNLYSSNMTLTAIVLNAGEEMRSDQIEIGAFSGAQVRGSATLRLVPELNRYIGFLMVYGDGAETITLRIYDHNEGKEHTPNNEPITFAADAINGNPSDPYIIRFGTEGDVTTGSSEITIANATIYPNPVSERLYIEREWATIDLVEIFDAGGRLVLRMKNFSDDSIDVSNLTTGVYVLNLMNNDEFIVIRFVKE